MEGYIKLTVNKNEVIGHTVVGVEGKLQGVDISDKFALIHSLVQALELDFEDKLILSLSLIDPNFKPAKTVRQMDDGTYIDKDFFDMLGNRGKSGL